MKKPISVYVFSILFMILYFILFVVNIWIFTSPQWIITNSYNFYICLPLVFIGFISSIILLVSKKPKVVRYSLTGVIAPTVIIMFLNMVGRFNNLELGMNVMLNIIVLLVFSFIKSFKEYLKMVEENEDKIN